MSATAARAASDRSDFRTVTVGGAKLGVATAVAVVAFLAASRLVPIAAGTRGGVQALIVLAAGMGGIVTAAGAAAARGETTLARRALPAVAGTVIVAAIGRLAGVPFAFSVITGGAFTLVLATLALVALARKG